MRAVPLTQGKVALIDDADYESVTRFSWHALHDASGDWRAIRGSRPQIQMSRFLFGLLVGDPRRVDHVNGDTLDYRRQNLRVCSQAENVRNRHVRHPSHLKGVAFDPSHKRLGPRKRLKYAGIVSVERIESKPWRAHICVNYQQIRLGRFATEEEAARAYDEAAIRYHGEFANLNFPLIPQIAGG